MAGVEQVDRKALESIVAGLGGALGDAIREAMKAGAHEIKPNRDNPNYVPDSVYAPKGVEKEKLRRRTWFAGAAQDESVLTPEEVHLFNQLRPVDQKLVVAGVPRMFSVVEKQDGNSAELRITFPMSVEERASMPPLTKLLRALIAGVSELE